MTTSYRYDSVSNLLEQAISSASEMALSYAYSKNGSMVEKALSSQSYGKLTDI